MYKQINIQIKFLAVILSTFFIIACSNKHSVNSTNSQRVDNELVIPPDLSKLDSNKNIQLPNSTSIDHQDFIPLSIIEVDEVFLLKKIGQKYVLQTKTNSEQVWFKLIEFWQKDDINLVVQNYNTGVIETDWLINYAEFSSAGAKLLYGILNKISAAGQRDKYRMQIDEGINRDTIDIHITHAALEKVALSPGNKVIPDYKWVKRSADPELELEIIRQVLVHFGVTEKNADKIIDNPLYEEQSTVQPIQTNNTDQGVLLIANNINNTWRRVGYAIDHLDYVIIDRDRQSGTYTVEPQQIIERNNSGFLSRYFNSNNNMSDIVRSQIKIQLIAESTNTTNIFVTTNQGIPDKSQRAINFLEQINYYLN